MEHKIIHIMLAIVVLLLPASVAAQTTEFTYQGKISDTNGTAASYDFQFRLCASQANCEGADLLGTQARPGVSVSNGVFTVALDFGGQFTGASRFLEIGVKPAGSSVAFTILTPRQTLTSAPYSVRSLNAATAADSTQLGGAPANQFVQTSDSRLTDDRNPLAGSANYVQNTVSLQTGGNFNISGTGAAGILSAATQFNLDNRRILTSPVNTDNLFLGQSTGQNATGFALANTFVGSVAGRANTNGAFNTFIGASAGLSNTTAEFNTFVGASAGRFNTTGGNNTFVGLSAGSNNSTGGNNSFFGKGAGGECGSINSCPNPQTGANNSFYGFETGFGSTTGENNSYFGANAGRLVTTGSRNSFFGVEAGRDSAENSNNSFFGYAAGRANTGTNNSFFGANAGNENTGGLNSFFGISAGRNNSLGSRNSFFGASAGASNLTADRNSFFGNSSGINNTTGTRNSFFGDNSGLFSETGSDNSFFGQQAGQNTTTGGSNTILGSNAGLTNTVGSNITLVGRNANVSANNLTFAAAFGSGAVVSTSNTIALGRTSGADTVRIYGNLVVDGTTTFNAEQTEILESFVKKQDEQIKAQAEQLRQQQILIRGLKKIVCQSNPTAEICLQGENK